MYPWQCIDDNQRGTRGTRRQSRLCGFSEFCVPRCNLGVRDIALRVLSTSSLVLLGPVLFLQGRRVRRVTPRLPPAAGPQEGTIGTGPDPLRLAVVGESTAMGVGVPEHAVGLAGQTARALGRAVGRPVRWRVLGRSGATARALLKEFIEPAPPLEADVVVVILGVNDTLGFSSPRRWTGALDALLASLRRRSAQAPVVVAAVPPMQHFPAFPSPLRHVLGLRAHVLDRAAIRWAGERPRVAHVPYPHSERKEIPDIFCSDGFHPSAMGYERWSAALAAAAATLLR
jgi:lysophospholipase L1-like esterase